MSKVVAVKPHNITLGVLDKTVQLFEDLGSVTFTDHNGTAHTVNTHVDGPFKTPEDVISAFENGVLHTFKSHDAALAHWTDQGDHEFVKRLEQHINDNAPASDHQEGGEN